MDSDLVEDNDLLSVFEAIHDRYMLLAADPPTFSILAITDSYRQLTGTARDELLGKSLFRAFPPNPDQPGRSLDALQSALETAVRTREPQTLATFRYDIRTSDGGGNEFVERYWSPYFKPLVVDDEVRYILHRAEDVTEFVLRDRHARADHDIDPETPRRVLAFIPHTFFESIADQLSAPGWEFDPTDDADEFLELARHPSDVYYICAGAIPDRALALVEKIEALPDAFSAPIVVHFPEFLPGWFERAYAAGADDVTGPTATAREIMARLQTRVAMAELSATLREQSRQRYYRLFEQAPVAVAIMEGPDLIVTMANPAHQKMIGGRQAVGERADEVLPGPEYQKFYDRLQQVYREGTPYSASEVPYHVEPVDGDATEQRYATFTYLPFEDIDGEVVGVASFAYDVTEQVENRERLLEAKQIELENRRKDEFLAMLGHELRNPLTPIATAAELLATGDEVDGERARWAGEVIDRQVDQLTALVDDLLDVGRINRGTITFEPERCLLRSFIDAAVDATAPGRTQKSQTLHVDLPDEVVTVRVDPHRMIQIVSNLLDNASKYSPEDTDIWLAAETDATELTLEVRDQGRGLSEELLPHVFDLFTQADASLDRPDGGLGLGLHLVKELAELHGGGVEAYSEGRGHGSRFVVHLPVLVDEGPEAVVSTAIDLSSRRVLLVEDNPDVADAVSRLLNVAGHDVEVVSDGPAALEALEDFEAEIVLMDIGLPGMDGYEVMRRMRQSPPGRDVFAVALTGYGRESDRERAFEAGFDRHLTKPVDLDTLEEVFAAARPGSR